LNDEDEKTYAAVHSDIDEFLTLTDGQIFSGAKIDNLFGFKTRKAKRYRWQVLKAYIEKGQLESRGPDKYRKPNSEFEEIDVMSAVEGTQVAMSWPMGLEKYLKVYPKSIIIVAAAPGKGKTAFLHNLGLHNRKNKLGVVMFSNDMTDVEIKERWLNTGLPLTKKPFPVYEVYNSFGDAIREKKSQDKINIIDYLDLNSDTYRIGDEIEDIYRAIDGGVAAIAIQKKPHQDIGIGGLYSWKRAKIYLSLDTVLDEGRPINVLKIIKARGRVNKEVNPEGMEIKYHLIDGIKFVVKEIG